MARILVNMPSQHGDKPSGVARVTFALLERLVALGGHDYVLRSNWQEASLPPALRGKVSCLFVPRPRIMVLDVMRQAIAVPRLCRRLGIDIVWNVDTFGSPTGGRARVTTVHDLFYRHVATLGRRARLTMALCYRMVLAGSTRIAAISQGTRRELAEAFPGTGHRTAIIANDTTLDSDAARVAGSPALAREVASPYVLIVGNATPNKNFGVVVAALSALQGPGREGGRALALVHVGVDEGGRVAQAMQAASHPPERIALAGIDDARLAGLYRHAECLVVPSLSEGFCLPIVEAQALGCPVVAAQASVLPEIAGAGALYFTPDDPADLSRRIEQAIARKQELVPLGHANRQRFSWDRSARAYAALFSELAA